MQRGAARWRSSGWGANTDLQTVSLGLSHCDPEAMHAAPAHPRANALCIQRLLGGHVLRSHVLRYPTPHAGERPPCSKGNLVAYTCVYIHSCICSSAEAPVYLPSPRARRVCRVCVTAPSSRTCGFMLIEEGTCVLA